MTYGDRIPDRAVTRLSLVLRRLEVLCAAGVKRVFSRELAEKVGVTAVQVRRDLMAIGYSGSPNKGYEVCALSQAIKAWLHPGLRPAAALVGLGNLGRALLTYFRDREPHLDLLAAFDIDPGKTCMECVGLAVHHVDELERVCKALNVRVAILTLPPEAAQAVAERLAAVGVHALVNFTHASLRLDPHVFVEDVDLSVALDRAVFFSHKK
ncbi:MAG: redox-sensing transcriptional repressor Rex [Deltaproteobacteria bacterium]|nr:redox-sensing transcriptional repressor Rex [Deltaproteobacteria bacterium]